MVDHRIALRVIGARSIAVSAVFLVQGKYVDAIPAFLQAYGMAVGGGHDRADSRRAGVHVPTGQKRHGERNGTQTQPDRRA